MTQDGNYSALFFAAVVEILAVTQEEKAVLQT